MMTDFPKDGTWLQKALLPGPRFPPHRCLCHFFCQECPPLWPPILLSLLLTAKDWKIIRGQHPACCWHPVGTQGTAVPFQKRWQESQLWLFISSSSWASTMCWALWELKPKSYPALRVQQGPRDPKTDSRIQQEKDFKVGRPGRVLQGEQPLDLVSNDELPSLRVGFLGASSVSGSALSPLQKGALLSWLPP